MRTPSVPGSRWMLLAAGVLVLFGLVAPAQQNAAQVKPIQDLWTKGDAQRRQGNLPEAIRLGEQAEALARQTLGQDDLITAFVQNDLGNWCWQADRYENAENWYLKCLATRRKAVLQQRLKADGLEMQVIWTNLGRLYEDWKQFPQARTCFQNGLKCLETRTPKTSKDREREGYLRRHLGFALRALGEFVAAEEEYVASKRIREQLKADADVADSLNHLGQLHWSLGQFGQAEQEFNASLQIRMKYRAHDPLPVAETLQNRAMLYRDQGLHTQAKQGFEEALKVFQAQRARLAEARCLSNLGHLCQALNLPREAETYLLQSKNIFDAQQGDHSQELAQVLSNLGWLYHARGDLAKAEAHYLKGLQLRQASTGNDRDLALSEQNLALLHASRGEWDQAIRRAEQAQTIAFRYATDILPSQVESQQLDFLIHQHQPSLSEVISVGVQHPQDAAASAKWVLNGKGLAQQVLAERALRLRDLQDPRLAQQLANLQDIRSSLAAQIYVKPKNVQQSEVHRSRVGKLSEQEAQLTASLIGKALQRAHAAKQAEVQEVRAKLPPEAVLIEIAEFGALNFRQSGGLNNRTRHYAAWVIPPQGKGAVQAVDLGATKPIDDAVRAVRQALREKEAIKKLGEKTSEHQIKALLQTVSNQVLRPLGPHIDGFKSWIVSADGLLWLVPWAALPLASGHYAIEDHVISHVVSGRDLVRFAPPASGGGALIVADPDYDAPAAGAPAPHPLALNLVPRVKRLPYTAAEAQGIKADLASYVGTAPEIHNQKEARESLIKNRTRRPRVLVLSTHGFFLEELNKPTLPGSRSSGATLDNSGLPSDPLLRCGLIFAAANNRHQVSGTEDGLLTGREIVQLDLRGTELVVLSACETGLGEVRNGEGVASLRQAFQLAGARNVVSTLWEIPEQESTALMVGFFGNLAKHESKAEALRNSQLALIETLRSEADAAHPFYWAAYTVTGRD